MNTNIYKSRTIIESDTNIKYWLQHQTVNLKAVSADNYAYTRNGGSVAGLESGYRGDVICMI